MDAQRVLEGPGAAPRRWVAARGVVVGWDGSLEAQEALAWGAAEAVQRGCPLVVAHAGGGYAPWVDPAAVPDVDEYVDRVAAEGARRAVEAVAACGVLPAGPVAVGYVSDLRRARDLLVEASDGADLLVVGDGSRGELLGALAESVSSAVAAHARCPVVVVRGDGPVRPGPDLPVVVGVDGSEPSDAAVVHAAGAAHRAGAVLRVLVAGSDAPEEHVLAETAARRAEDLHPGLEVTADVEVIGTSAGLLRASREAGLVVVGSRGRGAVTGLLLGSTGLDLVHRARCPVAVVHSTS